MLDPPGEAAEITARRSVDVPGILARTGQTVLLVTHSVAEAVSLSERVAMRANVPGAAGPLYGLIQSEAQLPSRAQR
jgi:ABC-type nitrate/sulfonate/bicarbonate transport system ATPase subunit